MIIFIDKKTNFPVGTIEGRVHGEQHLKMWIGEKNKTYRIIIEYKTYNERFEVQENKVVTGYKKDKEGFDIPIYGIIRQKVKRKDFKPMLKLKNGKYIDLDNEQIEILKNIEDGKNSIYHYKINKKTKKFIKR
jgi:hypothetical protein